MPPLFCKNAIDSKFNIGSIRLTKIHNEVTSEAVSKRIFFMFNVSTRVYLIMFKFTPKRHLTKTGKNDTILSQRLPIILFTKKIKHANKKGNLLSQQASNILCDHILLHRIEPPTDTVSLPTFQN